MDKVIPAAFALGALGWVMGMILDKPRRRAAINYNKLFLDHVEKESFPKVEVASEVTRVRFTPEAE